jgi:NAD(P)-dependent dehydrogenase (short-subunit alcohol dehydrogenase family)
MTNHEKPDQEVELERARKALRRLNPRGARGRRILISGGLGFTGSALVETYRDALPEAELCVTDFPRRGWEEAWKDDPNITFYPADFFDPQGVPALVNHLSAGGGLTDAIMIHGGGGRPDWELPGREGELNDEDTRRLNFSSVYELLNSLLQTGILNGSQERPVTATVITSLSRFPSWQHPSGHGSAYGQAKNDLYHVMRYLASRWELDHYVRIHIVCPGTIIDTIPQTHRKLGKRRPSRHNFARSQDIANAVLSGTELGDNSIGVEVIVDGGQRFIPVIKEEKDPRPNPGEPDRELINSLEYGRSLVEKLDEELSAGSRQDTLSD